jgi:hypothetical protein
MIMLGRQLKDSSAHNRDSPVAANWKEMWRAKEEVMRIRLGKQVNLLDNKAHNLPPPCTGQHSQTSEHDRQ